MLYAQWKNAPNVKFLKDHFTEQVEYTLNASSKYSARIYVSKSPGPVHKELRSPRAVWKIRKLNKLRTQQLFLDSSENWGHRAKPCSRNCKDRKIQDNQSCIWWIAGDSALTIPEEPVFGRPRIFCEFCWRNKSGGQLGTWARLPVTSDCSRRTQAVCGDRPLQRLSVLPTQCCPGNKA